MYCIFSGGLLLLIEFNLRLQVSPSLTPQSFLRFWLPLFRKNAECAWCTRARVDGSIACCGQKKDQDIPIAFKAPLQNR